MANPSSFHNTALHDPGENAQSIANAESAIIIAESFLPTADASIMRAGGYNTTEAVDVNPAGSTQAGTEYICKHNVNEIGVDIIVAGQAQTGSGPMQVVGFRKILGLPYMNSVIPWIR